MLHKNLIEQKSGFRTIENHEIDAISGGIYRLYVGAQRPGDINAFTQAHGDGAGGLGGGNPFASLGAFQPGSIDVEAIEEWAEELEANADTFVDRNGDGLDDVTGQPLIIGVDAPRVELAETIDLNGDGNIDVFVFNLPQDPLPTTLSDLDLSQAACIALGQSLGVSPIANDVNCGTNLSERNPNEPGISAAEERERMEALFREGIDDVVDRIRDGVMP